MKKIILISSILLAFGLISCSNSSSGKSDPNLPGGDNPPASSTTREWKSAIPADQSAAITDNGDGTISATFTSAYNGNGIVVYINEDETKVEKGKKVNVTFEYKTKVWSNNSLKPKFKVALCTAAESYHKYTTCTEGVAEFKEYYDAEDLEGEVTLSRTASEAADMLAIQFNAYDWKGDTTDDSIEIKLKSVEIE